ncbi:MAG: FG-GAP repeat protein [Marinicella sp.]
MLKLILTFFILALLAIKPNVSLAGQSLFNQAVYLDQTLAVTEGYRMGQSAAVNPAQSHMVIGSSAENTMGKSSGAAYLFEQVNGQWQEVARLLPPTQANDVYFGRSVAISDQWVAVSMTGSSFNDSEVGKIFVYDLNGVLQTVLEEPSVGVNGGYGIQVALSQNTLAVAAPYANVNQGRVWVYEFNANTQNWNGQELINPTPQIGSLFGDELILNPNADGLLVAASKHSINGLNHSGLVQLYGLENGNWLHQETIAPPTPIAQGNFGHQAAFSTDVIAISQGILTGGDLSDDRVEVFEKAGNGDWIHTETFQDAGQDHPFGYAMVANEARMIIVQSNGLQVNYREGFSNWAYQELVPKTNSTLGFNGLGLTSEYLVANSVGQGVTLLQQQPIVRGGTAVCGNPANCEWTVVDQINWEDSSDTSVNDQFGVSVDVFGNLAVVGVYADDDQGNDAGAAYVYAYNAETSRWQVMAKLYASDAAAGDQFGRTVAIDQGRIVIGAHLDDVFYSTISFNAENAGSVYVFESVNGQWTQIQKIHSDEGIAAPGDRFGFAVDLNQSRLLVGAYLDDENADNSGAVFAYEWDGAVYQLEEKILPQDGLAGDGFGYALSLDNNQALIGAYLADDVTQDAGAAYIYQHLIPPIDSWVMQEKLTPVGLFINSNDVFGAAVGISGDLAVVGAPKFDQSAVTDDDQGGVFVYRKDSQNNWIFSDVLTNSSNQLGAQYGRTLAIEGDRLLVGAWLQDYDPPSIFIDTGMAYFYRWNPQGGGVQNGAWMLGAELVPAALGPFNTNFAHAVSISGSQLLIGGHRIDWPGNNFQSLLDRGAVFQFVDDLIFFNGFE